MKKIMVIGVSAGVGKSTFAKRLGEVRGLKVHHLDTLYWKPGWIEAPLEEFRAAQEEIVKNNEWIIEGNYSSTFDLRMGAADTIIYLELPLRVCLYRVVKRRIQNHGKTRSDMTKGCPEKLDWPFIKFIVTTYKARKRNMAERFQSELDDKQVFVLNSKKDIEAFFDKWG
jgi:adenylate kinase family enzyme